jgi:dipeptidyl aminopeptidase/acylaminoacyl peptidase
MYGNRGGSQVRSLEYSEFYRGNLRDYGIQDKKVVIERLAKKYSFMDLNRVGIWGGSSGGYMAVTAMLLNPEFYKVCISRSGVQDPSVMYRWWVDSFQGITETTDENGKVQLISKKVPSNLEIAEHLQGRLLLIQGEADVIVHPANAIRLADVLMSMHKRFDYILVPGGGHGASKHWAYIKNRIWLYFIEHLLGDQRYQNSIDLSSFMTREIPGKIR